MWKEQEVGAWRSPLAGVAGAIRLAVSVNDALGAGAVVANAAVGTLSKDGRRATGC